MLWICLAFWITSSNSLLKYLNFKHACKFTGKVRHIPRLHKCCGCAITLKVFTSWSKWKNNKCNQIFMLCFYSFWIRSAFSLWGHNNVTKCVFNGLHPSVSRTCYILESDRMSKSKWLRPKHFDIRYPFWMKPIKAVCLKKGHLHKVWKGVSFLIPASSVKR